MTDDSNDSYFFSKATTFGICRFLSFKNSLNLNDGTVIKLYG
jgi:hypothetical protein